MTNQWSILEQDKKVEGYAILRLEKYRQVSWWARCFISHLMAETSHNRLLDHATEICPETLLASIFLIPMSQPDILPNAKCAKMANCVNFPSRWNEDRMSHSDTFWTRVLHAHRWFTRRWILIRCGEAMIEQDVGTSHSWEFQLYMINRCSHEHWCK